MSFYGNLLLTLNRWNINYLKHKTMTITFNELRRIKDQLPSGSSQRIADELGLDIETVRNYFGGRHFDSGNVIGIHIEPGPDGGVVTFDDTRILDCAKRILDEHVN